MLEKMGAFFDTRLEGYDEHMLHSIEGAEVFYPFTAQLLPDFPKAQVLDLGCGTGLELGYYFARNPYAEVTGIDLAPGMLNRLQEKFPDRELTLICGSYFEVPLEENRFHAAVSVESLHHFTQAQKLGLYKKLYASLKPGGYFVLTDYFARDDENEAFWRSELARLKQENGIADDEFYHYDTPLTLAHETEALLEAGFDWVNVLGNWGATYTLKAEKMSPAG